MSHPTFRGTIYELHALPSDGETDRVDAGEHYLTVMAAGCKVAGHEAVSLQPGEAAIFTYNFAADDWRMEKVDLAWRVREQRRRVEAVRARLDGTMPLREALLEIDQVHGELQMIFKTNEDQNFLPEEITRIQELQSRHAVLSTIISTHRSREKYQALIEAITRGVITIPAPDPEMLKS